MNASDPLKTLLENLGKGYARREVNVEFDEQPRITQDGETIYVWNNPGEVLDIDLGGANEFRVIRDTLNHETAHDRWSELDGKAAFSARYPENSKLAGAILNRLEDSYIDSRRLAEYPGLRHAHAFFTESQMGDAEPVNEMPKADALVRCVDYYGLAGRVPGIRDADDDVREFAAWVKVHVDELRRTDDAFEREHIAARIMDELVSRMPDSPDLDDLADEIAEGASGELPDEASVENMPDMNTPDDEDVDEVAEDRNLPEPPKDPWTDETREDEDESGDEGGDGGPEGDEQGESEQAGGEGEGESEDGENDESGDESDAGAGGSNESDEDEAGEQGGAGGDESAEGDEGEDDPQGAGEQGDDEDESGSSSSDDAGGEKDRSGGLSDELEELDERDEAGESPEHHGVDSSENYDEPTEADERRYERVEDDAAAMTETEVGRRKAERDSKIEGERHSTKGCDATSDEVRQVLRETGLAQDIRRAFEKFATEDVTVRDEDGDRLNVEAAIRHMSGDYGETAVYETDYTAATGGRCLGVALDLSSSMRHDGSEQVQDMLGGNPGAIVDAKVALGGIHLAAHEMGDELVASGFKSPNSVVETPLITAPGESFSWDHLDAVTYGGTTPTAHAVLDVLGLIREQGGTDEVMLVVTDGLPKTGHPELDGTTYAEDAGIAVNMARAQGVSVIGVGVGSDVRRGKMTEMFGADGYVMTDSETLVDDLVEVYAEQLDYERPAGY